MRNSKKYVRTHPVPAYWTYDSLLFLCNAGDSYEDCGTRSEASICTRGFWAKELEPKQCKSRLSIGLFGHLQRSIRVKHIETY